MEPEVRFAERPTIPEAGSDEEKRWSKMSTITYNGGYIRSQYGNFVQTWNVAGQNLVCSSAEQVTRAAYSATRTNTIGGESTTVSVPSSTYTKYARKNGSGAAGGDPFYFQTDVGGYSVRVGGDIQTLIGYICENTSSQFGTLTVYSNRGAIYGPFSASSST